MTENKCANCSMRARYEKKPDSLISKIWKWHLNWCPGWKAYLMSRPENERNEIIIKYGSKR